MEILEIINSGGESLYYFTKDHVNKKDFLKAVHDHVELEYFGSVDEVVETGTRVLWRWWRAVPDQSGEFAWKRYDAKPKSRGAFKVTCVATGAEVVGSEQ